MDPLIVRPQTVSLTDLMNTFTIPLFPLGTVLFPGGPLPLRIFEPRYLDMISDRLKQQRPFGICLIRTGKEVGATAEPYRIGTLANIVDWNQLPDGFLGITVEGGDRFTVESTEVQADNLLLGSVAVLPSDPIQPVPAEFRHLVNLLTELIDQAGTLYAALEHNFEDCGWVSYRLSELLPIPVEEKQRLLEISSPFDRLTHVNALVEKIAASHRQ